MNTCTDCNELVRYCCCSAFGGKKQPEQSCCPMCDDGDGGCVYPYYGVAPHFHDTDKSGWIGSTVLLPKEEWGSNFREDPECHGSGTYMRCPACGRGEAL